MYRFGRLNRQMRAAVRAAVSGRHVTDLGCGSGAPMAPFLACHADAVVCVDRRPYTCAHTLPANVTYVQATYAAYAAAAHGGLDVVFLSWPETAYEPSLTEMVRRARSVIFLGCNDGLTACGFRGLVLEMLHRPLLREVKASHNDLYVLGTRTDDTREPTSAEATLITWEESDD